MTGTLESFKADLESAARARGVELQALPDEECYGAVYRASRGGKSLVCSFTLADVDAANFCPGLFCSAIAEDLAGRIDAIGTPWIKAQCSTERDS